MGFITMKQSSRRAHRLRDESRDSDEGRHFEGAIQHGGANVEEGLHRHPVPAHLLFLVHALGDDLVDRTLDERRRDRFAVPTPGGVMHQLTLVL
jgi:hypothetical protein